MARGPRGNRSNPQLDAETPAMPLYGHLVSHSTCQIDIFSKYGNKIPSIVFTTSPPCPQIQCANDSLHIPGLG